MMISIMEKNKAGKVVPGYVYGRGVAILNRVAQEGITVKVTFDQRPKGGAGITHADIWRNRKCQAPGAEVCLMDQQIGQSGWSPRTGGESGRS